MDMSRNTHAYCIMAAAILFYIGLDKKLEWEDAHHPTKTEGLVVESVEPYRRLGTLSDAAGLPEDSWFRKSPILGYDVKTTQRVDPIYVDRGFWNSAVEPGDVVDIWEKEKFPWLFYKRVEVVGIDDHEELSHD